jgi:hypothetical protein
MTRKTIDITEEDFQYIIEGSHTRFKSIEDSMDNFDSEKGFVDINIIVQDGDTFYKGTYTKGSCGDHWFGDLTLTQVFPKQKIVTVYE